MKKSFLKKLMIALTAFTGVFVMASCQSGSKSDAKIPTQESSVKIVEQTIDGKLEKFADVVLCIDNNTIYNIDQASFSYIVHFNDGKEEVVENELTAKGETIVRHGVRGYLGYRLRLTDTEYAAAEKVTITKVEVVGFRSLWETYMPAFIAAIVLGSLSILFFAFELFGRKHSKEELKEMFKEHMASEFTILALVLVICLIPLIFSSWVTTVVLLGTFVVSILVNGLLTLLKMTTAK
ncbi:MAG: hypothetical protein KBS97_02530 [Firmicutes bacterium]|nr:hypothetical protein [Candidatus Fiminaster equi]